jgi:uncharacterized protein DUF4410
MRKRTIGVLLALLVIAPLVQARGKAPVLEPGKYKEWGEDIDQIEIVKPFSIARYEQVIVQRFDTSKAPLPDPNAKWYSTLKLMLAGYTEAFTESFQKELKAKPRVLVLDQAPASPKTLIVRGVVEELDPGTRGGRLIAGYGAGAAYTRLYVEIVDAASGEILVRLTQARRSAGTFRFGGGSDIEVMRDSIHAMGKDIAHVLYAFQ